MDKIDQILLDLPKKYDGLSDIHLSSGKRVSLRHKGDIVKTEDIITLEDMQEFMKKHLNKDQLKEYLDTFDLDFAVVVEGQRFRANAFKTMTGHGCVLRLIVTDIPDIKVLNLPEAVFSVLDKHAGLVLVTGQTGSGKSTSLAAMIDQLNKNRDAHIITIEDPIEFTHIDKKCVISQREVGRDTSSFARALKAALREDPDIILLGELRDYETVSMALTAAETGHLVFGTLHTSGASSTINRIIDAYPAEEQDQARSQLSTSLQMVMTQRLFKRTDKGGRIGAFEVMVCNSAIRNLIRENKIPQIDQMIETGSKEGMIKMDKYISELVSKGIIDQPDAKSSH
tara:strand:- start:2643 stop:3665 length:1023 start_codon:yes stop_codon:yes gene_type:complete